MHGLTGTVKVNKQWTYLLLQHDTQHYMHNKLTMYLQISPFKHWHNEIIFTIICR